MCECIQTNGKPRYHDVGCKVGYPNKPHKHAKLIIAWADGAVIEERIACPPANIQWATRASPQWLPSNTYRIKPEKKPDIVQFTRLSLGGECELGSELLSIDNIKVTFDGETEKLKKVEIV